MNTKNLVIAAVVGGILVLAGALTAHAMKQVPTPVKTPKVGAIGSPEITENHISINGVTTWTLRQNFQAATTSLCAIPNPNGLATSTDSTGVAFPTGQPGLATSTLLSFSVQVSTGTSTAATFDISTSSSAFSSSSPSFVYGVSIGSGAKFSGNWVFAGAATSSDVRLLANSPWASGDANKVGPAEFVTVKTAGAGVGGYTYGGQCIAVFRSLSAF